jgi:hypothetical protein
VCCSCSSAIELYIEATVLLVKAAAADLFVSFYSDKSISATFLIVARSQLALSAQFYYSLSSQLSSVYSLYSATKRSMRSNKGVGGGGGRGMRTSAPSFNESHSSSSSLATTAPSAHLVNDLPFRDMVSTRKLMMKSQSGCFINKREYATPVTHKVFSYRNRPSTAPLTKDDLKALPLQNDILSEVLQSPQKYSNSFKSHVPRSSAAVHTYGKHTNIYTLPGLACRTC